MIISAKKNSVACCTTSSAVIQCPPRLINHRRFKKTSMLSTIVCRSRCPLVASLHRSTTTRSMRSASIVSVEDWSVSPMTLVRLDQWICRSVMSTLAVKAVELQIQTLAISPVHPPGTLHVVPWLPRPSGAVVSAPLPVLRAHGTAACKNLPHPPPNSLRQPSSLSGWS